MHIRVLKALVIKLTSTLDISVHSGSGSGSMYNGVMIYLQLDQGNCLRRIL